MTSFTRRVIVASLAAAWSAPAFAAGTLFRSNGVSVPVDVRPAAGKGRRPAVILGHGRSGLAYYRSRFDVLAGALASRGIHVFIPHYFAVTGAAPQPEPSDANMAAWFAAMTECVGFVARQPGVDPRRIGYAGFSLGAYVGGVVTARGAPITALASNYAGLSGHFPADARPMPPTLMIQARHDPLIELADVELYRDRLRGLGARPELVVFESDQHVLEGADWTRSVRLMTDFFGRELSR